jgi:hypothetical protein
MTDTVTTPTTPNPPDNKPLFAFWSALEGIIRPVPSTQPQDMASLDKLMARLAPSEPRHSRLKAFAELTGLAERFNFDESLLNRLLLTTRDMLRTESGTLEQRREAFETLTALYLKQTSKFETFLLKNHLLSLLVGENATAKCLFLYASGENEGSVR